MADLVCDPAQFRTSAAPLCKAGFPLYDDKTNGTPMWKLRAKPFRGLDETGFSTTELCALYFSRTLIAALTGAPFLDDVERVMARIDQSLPAASRKYLDRLPGLVKAKATGVKNRTPASCERSSRGRWTRRWRVAASPCATTRHPLDAQRTTSSNRFGCVTRPAAST